MSRMGALGLPRTYSPSMSVAVWVQSGAGSGVAVGAASATGWAVAVGSAATVAGSGVFGSPSRTPTSVGRGWRGGLGVGSWLPGSCCFRHNHRRDVFAGCGLFGRGRATPGHQQQGQNE